MYPTLNLPAYAVKLKNHSQRTQIFDRIRKKFVVLTPEEWVRQHSIQYLIQIKNYNPNWIAVEKQITVKQLSKRADIVVYDYLLKPFIIVECKAPEVVINQKSFDQIARYNLTLEAHYLIVTNGLQHFYCCLNSEKKTYEFLEDLPENNKIIF